MTPDAWRVLPLVFIPGLGLGAESWSPTLQALQRTGSLDGALSRTLLLPGYGRPDHERAGLAPDLLARAVVDQLDAGSPALLIGLSAGCQVAAQVALQAPDRVAGLVLIGPTTDPRATTWPTLILRWFATARFEPTRQLPALVRQYRRTGLVTIIRAMDAARKDRVQDVVPLLACPTLALRGNHDRICPEDWLVRLTERLEDRTSGSRGVSRRWVSLKAGAHMVPYTHGELVADTLRGFIADLGGGRGRRDDS